MPMPKSLKSIPRQPPAVAEAFMQSSRQKISPARMAMPIVKTQPALCWDRVRFVGDPVALVVAETERQGEEGLAQVKIGYGPSPATFDAVEALKETAPQLHRKATSAQRIGSLQET